MMWHLQEIPWLCFVGSQSTIFGKNTTDYYYKTTTTTNKKLFIWYSFLAVLRNMVYNFMYRFYVYTFKWIRIKAVIKKKRQMIVLLIDHKKEKSRKKRKNIQRCTSGSWTYSECGGKWGESSHNLTWPSLLPKNCIFFFSQIFFVL